MALDLGIQLCIHLRTDATAAIGMSRRLGVGRVRHLDTSLFWIQAKVRDGDVLLVSIPGAENPADALTKHMTRPVLTQHLQRMNLSYEHGRAESAPQLQQAA